MDYKELKKKSVDELQKLLASTREELRKARFSVSQRQLKNVRKIRELKKDIAQILTAMRNIK